MNIKQYKRQLQESAWLLGICENGYDDLKANRIHWIDNGEYKGKKWFADPFILDYNDQTIHLFVEEFDYKVHRGRIAKLTIDRKSWTVTDCKIILDLETHLSFPMIWRQGDKVFVCPENYHSGGWNMYQYNAKEEKLTYVRQIINEKLTDAIIWSNGTGCYLLSTYFPTPNGNKLTIWKADELMNDFKRIQNIEFEESIGRNAGMMFNYNGQLLRPAQESNLSYGHALVFQKVKSVDGVFSFKEISRQYSTHTQYNAGMHTFNQHVNGMAVIDVKGYRYPKAAKILGTTGKMLVALNLKKQYRPK